MKKLSSLFNKFRKRGSNNSDEINQNTVKESDQQAQSAPQNSIISSIVWVIRRGEKRHRSSLHVTQTSVICISEETFNIQIQLISNIKQIHTALHSHEFILQGEPENKFYFSADSDKMRQTIIDVICSLSSGMKIIYCDTDSLMQLFEQLMNSNSANDSATKLKGTQLSKKSSYPSNFERGQQLSFEDFEMLDQIGAQDVWRYFRVRETRTSSKKILVMRVVNIQALRGLHRTESKREQLVKEFIDQQISMIKTLESSCYFIQQYYYIHAGNHFAVLQEELTAQEYKSLSFLLEKQIYIPENVVVVIAGQLAFALNVLHEKNIIFRQVNSTDVKIDMIGNLILSRFEFSKQQQASDLTSSNSSNTKNNSNSLSGRMEYLSPEMILGKGHAFSTDWWSYGIVLYELLIGFVPFADSNAFKMIEMILYEQTVCFPSACGISEIAKDLINRCLDKNALTRITFKEIKVHPFFENLNWIEIAERVPQKEVITFMFELFNSKSLRSKKEDFEKKQKEAARQELNESQNDN